MAVQQFIESVTKGADVEVASQQFRTEVAEMADLAGMGSVISAEVFPTLIKSVDDKKVGPAALRALRELADLSSIEVLLANCLPDVIKLFGHKDKQVGIEAFETSKAIMAVVSLWTLSNLIPSILPHLSAKAKPAAKEHTLKFLAHLSPLAPRQIAAYLVDLVPAVADNMWDIKKEVKNAAIAAMSTICACNGNSDLDPFLPVVLESIQVPTKVPEAVESLAGCVFVQNVCSPALAVITPVLVRGLNLRQEEIKRKSCVIIDNMCQLVEEPKEVLPLMPKLQPLLQKCMESISDPEARSVSEKAYKTLTKAGGEGASVLRQMTPEEGSAQIIDALKASALPEDEGFKATNQYVGELVASLANGYCFESEDWLRIGSLLSRHLPVAEAEAAAKHVMEQCLVSSQPKEEESDQEDEGVDLYKGVFSLAYGSLTLLNNTKWTLKRNKFYGLLGPNNCGKTTLMRAVANEQVEGFPKRDVLRTIFVEHEIQEREVGEDDAGYPIFNIDLDGIDWVVDTCNNVYNMEPKVTPEQVEIVMEEIGFGLSKRGTGKDRAADAFMGVTTYSGGWKMKMQLCAATLMNADILMLDEPTGHLDVKNIAWLEGWLQKFIDNGGSVIATSHDSVFLDRMCTHVIDFQDRKLKTFRGEHGKVLHQFVERFPEKQGYFELKNDVVKFVFPKPGPLDGVKSKSKAIMKMSDVNFQYPTRDTPTVMDIGLQVSQISRVAVIGPNGAGKSTAIKLLNGELKPSKGTIWKHPNMRLAYVAQHAFQHLEQHMTKTPVQYIMWRFAGNDDQESLEFKQGTAATDEDAKRQEVQWFLDPKQSYRLRKCETKEELKMAVVPESLMKRRELKKEKTKEYEVKWQFKSIEATNWIDRDTLIRMGFLKMVQRKDEQEAAASGLMSKPLTSQAIEKHLADFGVEAEAASHTFIQALSGGQKVKVVIAASMWQNPHLLILDEPTNYLDRDGLGALTNAIQEYEGGVIIISHNREFANAVSQEKWIMEAGRLRREGESLAKDNADDGFVEPEEVKDAFGNTIAVKREKAASDKEKKAELKRVDKQLKDHKKKPYLSEEEMWELQDRKAELEEALKK